MKKYRSSVGQGVYAVEYTAVSGDAVPHVLDSFIPLDGWDNDISRESGNGNECAYQDYIRAGKRSEESQEITDNGSADYTAQETFPCLVGTYFRQNLMSSEKFSPYELHDVIDFRKEYKE